VRDLVLSVPLPQALNAMAVCAIPDTVRSVPGRVWLDDGYRAMPREMNC
jgi:hypothetical protein